MASAYGGTISSTQSVPSIRPISAPKNIDFRLDSAGGGFCSPGLEQTLSDYASPSDDPAHVHSRMGRRRFWGGPQGTKIAVAGIAAPGRSEAARGSDDRGRFHDARGACLVSRDGISAHVQRPCNAKSTSPWYRGFPRPGVTRRPRLGSRPSLAVTSSRRIISSVFNLFGFRRTFRTCLRTCSISRPQPVLSSF